MEVLSFMGVMTIFPFLALLPTALFGWIWGRQRSRWQLAAAILWLFYAVWETSLYFRLTCSGECNIRVDLLLIYPVLLLVSLIAVVVAILNRRNRA